MNPNNSNQLIDGLFDPILYDYVPPTVSENWKKYLRIKTTNYFDTRRKYNNQHPKALEDINSQELNFYVELLTDLNTQYPKTLDEIKRKIVELSKDKSQYTLYLAIVNLYYELELLYQIILGVYKNNLNKYLIKFNKYGRDGILDDWFLKRSDDDIANEIKATTNIEGFSNNIKPFTEKIPGWIVIFFFIIVIILLTNYSKK